MTKEGTFVNNTVYFIKGNVVTLKYLLCYLNSKLIDWYYRTLSVQLGVKAVRMFSIYVEKLPIPIMQENKLVLDEYEICKSFGLSEDEIAFLDLKN